MRPAGASKVDRRNREGALPPDRSSRSRDLSFAFGPPFFLRHLATLVRQGCPDRSDRLPVVLLHLVDGESIDVCHVIGFSESWVSVAAHDRGVSASAAQPVMRTVLVPYETILRVSLQEQAPDGTRIGFCQDRPPELLAPESLDRAAAERTLAVVARAAPSGGASGRPGEGPIPSDQGRAVRAKRPRGTSRSTSRDASTAPGAGS